MGAIFRLLLRGLLLAAVTGAVTAAPAGALAQEDATADTKDKARTHYTKGKELYEAGNYAEAMVEFQAAYDAKPHPTVLKSVAECKVQVGDIPGAIAVFEKYLANPASTKKPEVEKRLAEVKAMLVTLEITTEPAGAGVVLDGETTGKTTPATIELGPGDHEVVLNAEGFEPLTKQVTLKQGEQAKLEVNLDEEGIPAAPPPEPGGLVDPFAEEEGGEEAEIEEDTGGPPPAFWVCAAVAGVGLVSGTVFGTMALGDEEDYKNNPTDDIKESGERNAIIADVSFGVAAAAAIVGAVILFTDSDDEDEETTAKSNWNVVPVAGGDAVGVSTTVTF
jgi:hypothetical protein